AKNRQLSELTVKYETAQKEQSIRLLQSRDEADRTRLQELGQQRNFILGGTALLLVISGLIYSRYRIKQRSNVLLQAQQNKLQELIKEKNNLITDKDHLLFEKDMLLKEVHHRVKNNLYIVMSLLESQSSFLNNDAAMTAILESQSRVRSIALIHQKLYSSTNMVQVEMQSYVPELIRTLADSFDTARRKIVIMHHIDNINIDVSQAIPIGIILNEAITNAIKYAFDERGGKIKILMRQQDDNRILLSITDDGIGIPGDIDLQNHKSLGMTLIRGLAMQLEGTISIVSTRGVKISIEFEKDENIHFKYNVKDEAETV
ncbi:MAG: sensor histidine kinase, partial [Mucilaginibacter sp.]|nr:sensor histidine kinase [Mucilaginibacter sp.]